ncbi:protein RST1 isoform X1 [Dendrobium catenatum]|uniref:protein RST1 isoform X1 n=1 Tax=Dendrobium catenatum TaxID=906689 RepID=UPI00109FD521|nr:protein RST1 isoform X1 [Dendrobium catenatum]
MDSTYAALLEKTRLPQPSFQRFAVVSLFRRLESSLGVLGPNSAVCHDAISQCLRSPFAAVVDQAVHELCRLVAVGDRLSISVALIEMQSALEGCEKRFAPVFVKGIGFLCRFAFCIDSSWGRRFELVDLHPFVKVLSCCKESHEELIEQVLLFIVRNKYLGINEVVRFLRPFIVFSMIWKSSSACVYFFSRNLISAIASLSCSFPLEAISILKLLTDCLKYLPLTNQEEFLYIVTSAEQIVDAFVVVLQQTVGIEKDVATDARKCSVEVLCMLLSICASFHRKALVQVEPVIEISRHLLVAQKELGLCYAFEFVNVVVSASVILAQVEFEHDQLSVLKLLILLMEWKTEELSTKRASCSLGEELLIVFPVINLLSSPSKPVRAAVTHLLSLAESFVLNFMSVLKKTEVSFTDCPILIEAETIPLRLLHHLFTQGQQLPYSSYFFLFTSDKITCDNEKYCGPLYWTSWLREHLLTIEREKTTFPQSSESHYEGVNILLGSIAYSLVISPAFDTSAVDPLVALGVQNPKLGMTMFQAALFYINILLKFERNSSKILLNLLEVLPSLASNSAMVKIIVQTILPMLHKNAKLSLHAVAIRLLCKTWVVSDRVFQHLQGVLSPKTLSNFESVREICVSVAASVRDVCKDNPDRGVDLILSVSSCIESDDSAVKALGLHSLSSLCEADVVDFYTAWEVVAKHVNTYTEEPVVAASLVTLLRWGALDVETYPDIARIIMLILWEVGTLRSYSSGCLWVKARTIAFQSMMHYEIVKFQEIIPEFKEKILQCLLNECNAEVLEAMEEFEIKIINFEHTNRRRALKERRPLGYKVAKLLDVFPQALFSPGNLNVNAIEFPGAALLSYVFTPKELQGSSNDVPRIHALFEKALIEIAESLPLSRNILIALLTLESWKAFIQQWIKALVASSDVKSSSSELDNELQSAGDILKICRKVAEEAVPQVSINAALAIGALCLVVPSSSYAVICSASDFLLNWLVDSEHEHHQWSSSISLGLISNCFHATDRMLKMNVVTVLIQEACNSKSRLVIGACGLGLGFACQGLLSNAEVDSNRFTEGNLLCDVIKTLSMVLSKLCPLASDSLKNLIESFLLHGYDSAEASSVLPQCKLDSLEDEEPWGIAGLVLGLGNCVFAMYRLGLNDAVLILKDILLSWVPSLEPSNKSSLFCNEMTEISLAVGACLAIPMVVAFCQNVELMIGDIDAILIRYVSLVSDLLNSSVSEIHYQNLVMASCIGAGSFISCILNDGVHSIRYDDIKHLLEFLRNGYSNSHPPLVHLGAMIGVVNAFGAAAGDLTYKHIQASFLPISLDLMVVG